MSHVEETHWHLLKPLDVVRCGKGEEPSAWLGRVIQNFNNPRVGYVSPEGVIGVNIESKGSHTHDKEQVFHYVDDPDFTDVQGLIDRAKTTDSRVQLSDFLEVSRTKKSSQQPSFTSKSVRRLRIEQEDEAISSIINDTTIRARLDKMIPAGRQAYLIAAILVTEDDVSYDDNRTTEKSSSLAANIPAPVVSAAASALTSAPMAVQNPIGLTLTESQVASSTLKTTIKGQNIIAIDYRVLDRPRSFPLASKKAVRLTTKRPPSDRFFGHNETMTSDLPAELPEIGVSKDPLHYFEPTAADRSFILVESSK